MIPVKKGILFLTKSGFAYQEIGVKNPLLFSFSPQSFRYMEVINQKVLELEVVSFISGNKLVPSNITVILGDDICFTKTIETNPNDRVESGQIDARDASIEKKFSDSLPFDEIMFTKIIKDSKTTLIGVSLELLKSIQKIFNASGFVISSIFPFAVFREFLQNKPLFDEENIKILLSKEGELQKYNMVHIGDNQKVQTERADLQEIFDLKKKSRTRLFLLIAVFSVLILVLILLVATNTSIFGT